MLDYCDPLNKVTFLFNLLYFKPRKTYNITRVVTMDFKERFKGRTTVMDKEGILGIIKSKGEPVNKGSIKVDNIATRKGSEDLHSHRGHYSKSPRGVELPRYVESSPLRTGQQPYLLIEAPTPKSSTMMSMGYPSGGANNIFQGFSGEKEYRKLDSLPGRLGQGIDPMSILQMNDSTPRNQRQNLGNSSYFGNERMNFGTSPVPNSNMYQQPDNNSQQSRFQRDHERFRANVLINSSNNILGGGNGGYDSRRYASGHPTNKAENLGTQFGTGISPRYDPPLFSTLQTPIPLPKHHASHLSNFNRPEMEYDYLVYPTKQSARGDSYNSNNIQEVYGKQSYRSRTIPIQNSFALRQLEEQEEPELAKLERANNKYITEISKKGKVKA